MIESELCQHSDPSREYPIEVVVAFRDAPTAEWVYRRLRRLQEALDFVVKGWVVDTHGIHLGDCQKSSVATATRVRVDWIGRTIRKPNDQALG